MANPLGTAIEADPRVVEAIVLIHLLSVNDGTLVIEDPTQTS